MMNDNQPKAVKSYRLSEDVVAKLKVVHAYHMSQLLNQGLRNKFSIANAIELMVNQEFDKIKFEAPEWVKTIELEEK